MSRLKIAIELSSLGLPPKAALDAAADMGAHGVELHTDSGEFAPEHLTLSGRRHVLKLLADRRLAAAALRTDPQDALSDPRAVERTAGRLRAIVDLAVGLQAPVLAIGVPDPPPELARQGREAREWALREAAGYAINYGVLLALDTPASEPEKMLEFLDSITSQAAWLSFDPAAFAEAGADPVAAAHELGARVAHVYARDTARSYEGGFERVPLGDGEVPFGRLADALEECNYGGYWTVGNGAGPQEVRGDVERLLEL